MRSRSTLVSTCIAVFCLFCIGCAYQRAKPVQKPGPAADAAARARIAVNMLDWDSRLGIKQDFRIVDENVVRDSRFGREWVRDGMSMEAGYGTPMTMEQAEVFTRRVECDGKSDWRLPELWEMERLLSAEPSRCTGFLNPEDAVYWTTTRVKTRPDAVWGMRADRTTVKLREEDRAAFRPVREVSP